MKLGPYQTNQIYFEDCYEAIKKIPSKSVKGCIYVDVPYLHLDGGLSKAGTELNQSISKLNDEIRGMSNGFDLELLGDFIRILEKTNIWIWCSRLQVYPIIDYMLKKNPSLIYDFHFWHKTNPIPRGHGYLIDKEICLLFREPSVPINELRRKYTVYTSPTNKHDKNLYNHPCIKPLDFVKHHLLMATNEGDLVIDFFCGSGTTCEVAKEINRQYIGFENDPLYYPIAVNRLKGVTAGGQLSIYTEFKTLFDEDPFVQISK